jgi:DNA-binding CsgD family transcriptional regulator
MSKLGITERTANFHFSNILSKLGAMNRAEAIAKAAARGLLDDP